MMWYFGILGINARNLRYVQKRNPREAIHLADDKLKTKRFLQKHGIPVPDTYFVLSSREEVQSANFDTLPETFVVKPNHGSRGRGITVLTRDHAKNIFRFSDTEYDDDTFRKYLADIVDGTYSLHFGGDQAFFEERIVPSHGFERFCAHGLADIRIIVVNLVPILAYIRMPTERSGWRANIHQWGIGLGLDIGDGKVVTLYRDRRIFTRAFPMEYAFLRWKGVPFWDEILLQSSCTQQAVNLGYLAVDWTITTTGPKILEINARAGLEIQNVTGVPLRKRIAKIEDMRIANPEKWHEIAKALFARNVSHISSSKVLSLSQPWAIRETSWEERSESIIVEVSLAHAHNRIAPALEKTIESFSKDVIVETQNYSLANPARTVDPSLLPNVFVLGRKAVSEYYIRPASQSMGVFVPKEWSIKDDEIERLRVLDKRVNELSRAVAGLHASTPINLDEAKEQFQRTGGRENPVFRYREIPPASIEQTRKDIETTLSQYFRGVSALQSDFAWLFHEKLEELHLFTQYLFAVRFQDFDRMRRTSERLYGGFDAALIRRTEADVETLGRLTREGRGGSTLSHDEVIAYIHKYLEDCGLSGSVRVRVRDQIPRFVVRRKSVPEISITRRPLSLTHEELLGILAHEVDVHIVRALSGRRSWWRIIESGTGFYLSCEEWLALYRSREASVSKRESRRVAIHYLALTRWWDVDFCGLFEYLQGFEEFGDFDAAFTKAARMKRNVCDTSIAHPGALFLKDKIYHEWYSMIADWIGWWGDIETLMSGKIKIADLRYSDGG